MIKIKVTNLEFGYEILEESRLEIEVEQTTILVYGLPDMFSNFDIIIFPSGTLERMDHLTKKD